MTLADLKSDIGELNTVLDEIQDIVLEKGLSSKEKITRIKDILLP